MKADFPAVSKYSICHRRFLIVNYWQTVHPNQHQLSQLMLSCFHAFMLSCFHAFAENCRNWSNLLWVLFHVVLKKSQKLRNQRVVLVFILSWHDDLTTCKQSVMNILTELEMQSIVYYCRNCRLTTLICQDFECDGKSWSNTCCKKMLIRWILPVSSWSSLQVNSPSH